VKLFSHMHPTRQLLLDKGLELARDRGLRGLTVRELTACAGANLGTFVYHFGNRDRFIEELVELWYAPLYAQLKDLAGAASGTSALERLDSALWALMQWALAHSPIVGQLAADALAGEPGVRAFAARLPRRHPLLLLRLLRDAQTEGHLGPGPALPKLLFLMAATGMPIVLSQSLGAQQWMPRLRALRQVACDPKAARQRLDWALRGLQIQSNPVVPSSPKASS
jgi:AcrR family transcriptional regulator